MNLLASAQLIGTNQLSVYLNLDSTGEKINNTYHQVWWAQTKMLWKKGKAETYKKWFTCIGGLVLVSLYLQILDINVQRPGPQGTGLACFSQGNDVNGGMWSLKWVSWIVGQWKKHWTEVRVLVTDRSIVRLCVSHISWASISRSLKRNYEELLCPFHKDGPKKIK